MLPKMLPNALTSAATYSTPEGRVEPIGSILLESGCDLAVEVVCRCHGRVPEALLCDLGVDAGSQQLRRVAVAQVVEADTCQRRRNCPQNRRSKTPQFCRSGRRAGVAKR